MKIKMVLNKTTRKMDIFAGVDKFEMDIETFKKTTKDALRQITMYEHLQDDLLNSDKNKTINQIIVQRLFQDQRIEEEAALEKINTFYHGNNPLD